MTFTPRGRTTPPAVSAKGANKSKGEMMMKRTYKTGWYGGATATINTHRDGTATLTVKGAGGSFRKTYSTEQGARIALGKQYDGTFYEVKGA